LETIGKNAPAGCIFDGLGAYYVNLKFFFN